MERVESWWDGSWSTLWTRRAHLEREGDTWRVLVTEGSERKQKASPGGTEERARALLAEVIATEDGWRRVR